MCEDQKRKGQNSQNRSQNNAQNKSQNKSENGSQNQKSREFPDYGDKSTSQKPEDRSEQY